MKHSQIHSGHMWLIAGGALAAVVLGYGIGWAIAIAMIGCGAMFVALIWLINNDRTRHDSTPEQDESRNDMRRREGLR